MAADVTRSLSLCWHVQRTLLTSTCSQRGHLFNNIIFHDMLCKPCTLCTAEADTTSGADSSPAPGQARASSYVTTYTDRSSSLHGCYTAWTHKGSVPMLHVEIRQWLHGVWHCQCH